MRKLCQFADDTNLFCADLMSVENGLRIIKEFGEISGLKLNIEKTKAMWLGKWSKVKHKPLNLKWVNCPTKILGIHFSYDEKANNELNFNLKLQRLQSNLDIWCSRDLTLFGKVLIIKTMGISSLVYSAANIDVPSEVINVVKSKIFRFLWKNKRDKIKRERLYQDYEKGGLRMVVFETMIKALRAPDQKYRESHDRKEISSSILFYQKYPFGKLFSKIIFKSSSAFCFFLKFR